MAPSLPPISNKAVPLQIDPFDDWETAYSRDEPILEKSSNAKLWSEANSSTPSYTLQLSSQSQSTSRLPPSTALLPGTLGNTMTILKRPSSAASESRSKFTGEERKEKTLVEREKDYEEARRRIYGEESLVEKEKKLNGNKDTMNFEGLSLNGSRTPGSGSKRGKPRAKISTGSAITGAESSKKSKLVVEGIRAPKPPPETGGGFSRS